MVFLLLPDSDDFTAYCLILPMLGIGPQWWIDSHNIHHVVCNDVHCGEYREGYGVLFFAGGESRGVRGGIRNMDTSGDDSASAFFYDVFVFFIRQAHGLVDVGGGRFD